MEGLDWNRIGAKREEAVIVGAGARHLIAHSGSRGLSVCTISLLPGLSADPPPPFSLHSPLRHRSSVVSPRAAVEVAQPSPQEG